VTRVLMVLATSAGGVGRHVAELAGGLGGTPGFEVVVAGPQDPGGGGVFEHVGIADRPRPRQDLAAVRRLRALIRRADVVHAHGLRAGALAGVAARLGAGGRVPVVVTLHNALLSGTASGVTSAVHRLLETIVARTATTVLVVSDDIGAAIAQRGAKDVRRAIVPAPALPPPGRSPDQVRRDLGVEPGTALLVTVARLAQQKGLDTLVDAVQLLPSDHPVLAVIAGDGPLEGELTRQIGDAPVRLLGRRDDVADLVAAADVVVLPSRWEGQPLVAQEAIRLGAALIATDAGGTAVVTGDGARLVRAGDPGDLAGAIAHLLTDPAARHDLQARARRRAADLPVAGDALAQVSALYAEVTRSE